jgi:hemerythrin
MAGALTAVRDEVAVGGDRTAARLGPFLRDWLIEHITRQDRGFAPFLNAKGVY